MAYAKAFFRVLNERGLHTRPSTQIVLCASKFRSEMKLVYRQSEVNAKSLLGILTLAAAKGSKIVVTAEGDDAERAVTSLLDLARCKFNITY